MKLRCTLWGLAAALVVAAPAEESAGEAQGASRDAKLKAARAIIEAARYCALITVDRDGHPRARTVDPFPPTDDMTVWIATLPGTRKLEQIRDDPKVTLYYQDAANAAYVTLRGRATIHDDPESKRAWKHPDVDLFWPDYPDGYTLIEVKPDVLELVGRGVDADERTWRPQSVVFPK